MVGRRVLLRVEKKPATPGAPLLQVKDLGLSTKSGVRRCSRRLLRRARRRDRRHRRRRRQRPVGAAGGRLPASAMRRAARSSCTARRSPPARARPGDAAPKRPRACAGGPASHGPRRGLRGMGERGARLSRRSALPTGPLLDIAGDPRRRAREDRAVRHPPAEPPAEDREFLRRQPAEDRAGARDRARSRRCCSSASRRAASISARSSSSIASCLRCARPARRSCSSRSSSTRSARCPTASW